MCETQVLDIEDSQAVNQAVKVVQAGGLIVFPTDTVYGLAAGLNNPDAIDLIYAVKGRETTKAVAVLIGAVEQLEQVTTSLPPAAARLAARFWPGALTLVVPRRADLPPNLSNLPTVGVRMPDHRFAQKLLQASGPLATTSANRSGAPDSLTAEAVLQQLDGKVHLVLDGGRCPGGVPSTVVDCTAADLRILRAGAIPAEEIFK
jgi:L-threonylcarbamoyladenylate synthase